MRKSDKKFDNELRKALTKLCENELETLDGFQWLTHTVNYPNVESSLKVICVFDLNENLERFMSSNENSKIESLILKTVSDLNIKLKNTSKQLVFDTEENCTRFNNGNWSQRLA